MADGITNPNPSDTSTNLEATGCPSCHDLRRQLTDYDRRNAALLRQTAWLASALERRRHEVVAVKDERDQLYLELGEVRTVSIQALKLAETCLQMKHRQEHACTSAQAGQPGLPSLITVPESQEPSIDARFTPPDVRLPSAHPAPDLRPDDPFPAAPSQTNLAHAPLLFGPFADQDSCQQPETPVPCNCPSSLAPGLPPPPQRESPSTSYLHSEAGNNHQELGSLGSLLEEAFDEVDRHQELNSLQDQASEWLDAAAATPPPLQPSTLQGSTPPSTLLYHPAPMQSPSLQRQQESPPNELASRGPHELDTAPHDPSARRLLFCDGPALDHLPSPLLDQAQPLSHQSHASSLNAIESVDRVHVSSESGRALTRADVHINEISRAAQQLLALYGSPATPSRPADEEPRVG